MSVIYLYKVVDKLHDAALLILELHSSLSNFHGFFGFTSCFGGLAFKLMFCGFDTSFG